MSLKVIKVKLDKNLEAQMLVLKKEMKLLKLDKY